MPDIYQQFLGVPPTPRPLTLYMLLGIAPTERSPEAIKQAADRRLALLQKHRAGPHAAVCAKVEKEIVQARDFLLDPDRRQQYDARLAAVKKAAKVPVAATRRLDEPAPKRRLVVPVLVSVAALLLLAAGGAVALLVFRPESRKVADRPRDVAGAEGAPAETGASPGPNPSGPAPGGEARPDSRPSPKAGPGKELKEEPKDQAKKEPKEEPKKEPKDEPADDPKIEAPPDKRAPVPAADAVAKAEKTVKEIFAEEYKQKGAVARSILAGKLIEQAKEVKDDPATAFVLYREARDLYAEAAALEPAVAAADTLAKQFRLDVLEARLPAVEGVGRAAALPEATARGLAKTALDLADAAALADNYDHRPPAPDRDRGGREGQGRGVAGRCEG